MTQQMRTWAAILPWAFVATSVIASEPTYLIVKDQMSVDLDEEHCGRLARDGVLAVKFLYENKTGGRLRIKDVIVTCPATTTASVSKQDLRPGECTELTVRCDVLEAFGKLFFGVTLKFDADAFPEQTFSVRCFKRQRPVAAPDVLDFGKISAGQSVDRDIVLTATGPPGEQGIALAGPIRASHSSVRCRFVRSATAVQRDPLSNAITSETSRLFFSASLQGIDEDSAAGFVYIPILYLGKLHEVSVPYRLQATTVLSARPDKIVVFASEADFVRELNVLIVSQVPVSSPDALRVSCDHPAISWSYRPLGSGRETKSPAKFRLTLKVSQRAPATFKTLVRCSVQTADGVAEIELPVEFVVVGTLE